MRKVAPLDGDRRQQILDAALDVFAEQGFEKATTKQIATLVGVAQGLVYFYFSSKTELLFATCEYQAAQALAQLDARCNTEQVVSSQVMLRNMLTRFIQVLDEPRTSKLLRIAARTHLPVEREQAGDSDQRKVCNSYNMHKQHINVLSLRLYKELLEHIQLNLPNYPQPDEIKAEADFFSGAMVTTLIRRALSDPEDVEVAKLTQQQLIDLLASNLFAWLAVKQAIIAGKA